ncbi:MULTISPECIES: hypothetical protein [unclassified Methylobacterium]|uniref:hypothetical protein n=1 Tax=unclassified Methylobacterium TaxID=2615210 RepID=UPI00226AE692|nr:MULTISPECIES: hypothetical protein [unclassified Methylobacterium]
MMPGAKRFRIRWSFLGSLSILCATPACAWDVGMPAAEVGARVTAASTRIGEHVDWGAGTCGEPKYLKGTCVWELGSQLSLTANTIGPQSAATMIVSRWSHFDMRDATTRKVFDQACRALVAALRPDWPAAKVAKFTSALIGPAKKDHEVKAEGIAFAFYTYPETLTCEAQPAT